MIKRFSHYKVVELLLIARGLFSEYWWFTYPLVIVSTTNFIQDSDLVNRIFALALMFPITKFVFTLIEMNEEKRNTRENEQYEREPAHPIGPITDVTDLPANVRQLKIKDPNWGNRIVESLRNAPFDDLPPEDPKVLDIPAYKRRGKKIDL